MITEDHVSFEVAKLLKEKGFPQEYDIYHSMVYNEEDYEDEYEIQRMVLETRPVKAGTLSLYPIGVPEPKCYCPTLQMAMKWLRKEHHILITIIPQEIKVGIDTLCYGIYRITEDLYQPLYNGKINNLVGSYEECVEAALKYSLENLI